jgi:hypothetical protein
MRVYRGQGEMRPRGETWKADAGGDIDLFNMHYRLSMDKGKVDRGGDAVYDRRVCCEMMPILRHISAATYVFTSYLSSSTLYPL